jgi:hypothetical protein
MSSPEHVEANNMSVGGARGADACAVCGQGASHAVWLRLEGIVVARVPVCAAHSRCPQRGEWGLLVQTRASLPEAVAVTGGA